MQQESILKYIALDNKGNKISGEFFGSKESLLQKLQKEGYFILKIEEIKLQKEEGKYRLKDFILDLENLYFLLESGTTIDEAINSIIHSTSNISKIKFWENVKSELKKGQIFSDALLITMHQFKTSFYPSFIALINTAEKTGKLKTGIYNFLILIKRIQEAKSKIISSLSYPLFLLLSTLIILSIIFLFIIPKFSSIFSPSDISKLSPLSRIEIEMGIWINSHFKESILISLLFIVGLSSFPFLLFSKLSKYYSIIPIFRKTVLMFDFFNLFSTLSLAMESGLTLSDALKLSKNILISDEVKNTIDRMLSKIQEGNSLSSAIQSLEIFPEEIKTVIKTSEKTASLPRAFSLISQRYNNILTNQIELLSKFLEPAIIVIIGLAIGIIIFGIMNAILGLSEAL